MSVFPCIRPVTSTCRPERLELPVFADVEVSPVVLDGDVVLDDEVELDGDVVLDDEVELDCDPPEDPVRDCS